MKQPLFCHGDVPKEIVDIVATELKNFRCLQNLNICVCKHWGTRCAAHVQLYPWRPVQFAPLPPSLFGPILWRLLHCCARHLPHRASDVLLALQYLLPCLKCQKHLQGECSRPDRLQETFSKSRFGLGYNDVEIEMFNLHNRVNMRKEHERAKEEGRAIRDAKCPISVLSKYVGRCVQFEEVDSIVKRQWRFKCIDGEQNTIEEVREYFRSKLCYIVLQDALECLRNRVALGKQLIV